MSQFHGTPFGKDWAEPFVGLLGWQLSRRFTPNTLGFRGKRGSKYTGQGGRTSPTFYQPYNFTFGVLWGSDVPPRCSLTLDGLLDGFDLLRGKLQYGRHDGHEAQLLVGSGHGDELETEAKG